MRPTFARGDGMSEPRAAFGYAWSPPDSGYLGAIILFDWPAERLTPQSYWLHLGNRIDRLIAAEGEAAWKLLEPVSRNEPWLAFERDIAHAGSLMAECGEWLRDRVHFPLGGIAAQELSHQPDMYEALTDDSLGEYIGRLYAGAA